MIRSFVSPLRDGVARGIHAIGRACYRFFFGDETSVHRTVPSLVDRLADDPKAESGKAEPAVAAARPLRRRTSPGKKKTSRPKAKRKKRSRSR